MKVYKANVGKKTNYHSSSHSLCRNSLRRRRRRTAPLGSHNKHEHLMPHHRGHEAGVAARRQCHLVCSAIGQSDGGVLSTQSPLFHRGRLQRRGTRMVQQRRRRHDAQHSARRTFLSAVYGMRHTALRRLDDLHQRRHTTREPRSRGHGRRTELHPRLHRELSAAQRSPDRGHGLLHFLVTRAGVSIRFLARH